MASLIELRKMRLNRLIQENTNKIKVWQLKAEQFPSAKMKTYSEMMVASFKEKNAQLKIELKKLGVSK